MGPLPPAGAWPGPRPLGLSCSCREVRGRGACREGIRCTPSPPLGGVKRCFSCGLPEVGGEQRGWSFQRAPVLRCPEHLRGAGPAQVRGERTGRVGRAPRSRTAACPEVHERQASGHRALRLREGALPPTPPSSARHGGATGTPTPHTLSRAVSRAGGGGPGPLGAPWCSEQSWGQGARATRCAPARWVTGPAASHPLSVSPSSLATSAPPTLRGHAWGSTLRRTRQQSKHENALSLSH